MLGSWQADAGDGDHAELNGAPVTRGELTVRSPAEPEPFDIAVSPRIGINECVDWPLRFYVAGSAFVSKAR